MGDHHQGFEPYHVPQQSRRDKLRFLPGQQTHQVVNSLFDPTSTAEFLTSAGSSSNNSVKEEHHNLISNYLNNSNPSSFRVPPQPYLDHHPNHNPQPSSNFHDINIMTTNLDNNSFHYEQHQTLFRLPEPLSLSLSSNPSSVEVVHNSATSYGYSGMTSDVGGPSPVGPFTGYASVLKGSRFLKPAQQLLEDLCDVGSSSRDVYASRVTTADESSSLLDDAPVIEGLEDPVNDDVGGESRRKKSCLISMLDEVYRRYKQYYLQMQAVITSFEYVAGLGNATPYVNLAIKAMTRHFKSLKNAIIDQLQYSRSNRDSTSAPYPSRDKDEANPMLRNITASRDMYGHRSFQSAEFCEQPVWRPQRGLPERAVTVLRSWLFEHFLHPYPTDTDKVSLAKRTGLSRSQVSNWFINARVRLWKPMVEEIHMLETRQAHQNSDRTSDDHEHLHSLNSAASENPSTSAYRARDAAASKRPRNEFLDVTVARSNHQLNNMSYNSLPSHMHHVGQVVGGSMAGGSASGVSLTLGLHHQHNGIGLSEPPYAIINTPQRFGLGLEGNNDGYTMGGFDAQNRHFGRDVVG